MLSFKCCSKLETEKDDKTRMTDTVSITIFSERPKCQISNFSHFYPNVYSQRKHARCLKITEKVSFEQSNFESTKSILSIFENQVSFNRVKIGRKRQTSNATCRVAFKQSVTVALLQRRVWMKLWKLVYLGRRKVNDFFFRTVSQSIFHS